MTFDLLWWNGVFGWLWTQHRVGIAVWVLGFVLAGGLSYLLGSLNFTLLISKYKYHDDVGSFGTDERGLLALERRHGRMASCLAALGDGAVAVFSVLVVGRMCCGVWGAALAGLCCLIGHAFPFFFGFRGGKGILTTAMILLCLNPTVAIVEVVIFVLLVVMTKYISLASIICMMAYPMLQSRMVGNDLGVVISLLIAALVIFLHRDSFARLREGTEPKFALPKREKKPKSPKKTK